MRLPNAKQAAVDREKVVSYLLNGAHPDNGGKAAFFEALGFDRREWEPFAMALRELATTGTVGREMATIHGTKYVVDEQIEGPRGRSAFVRTVWIIDRGLDTPRLVTAYPFERNA